ncbi:MAG TPA: hypothetical protein VN089_18040 [Duganella sp.]|nr:hypothetical protein [Duganella sp.]
MSRKLATGDKSTVTDACAGASVAEPTWVIVEELTGTTGAVSAVGETSGKFAALGALKLVDEMGNMPLS